MTFNEHEQSEVARSVGRSAIFKSLSGVGQGNGWLR